MNLKLVFSLAIIPVVLAMLGCNFGDSVSDGESSKVGLPKLDFHRPKSIELASQRLGELHTSLVSDSDLPKPRRFTIKEVIHGTGASAHSHYYRITDDKETSLDDPHDGHDNMKSQIRMHDLDIDVFTELIDIAHWMPKIAAESDIDKVTWDQIKKLSAELHQKLISQIDLESNDDSKRESYLKIENETEILITKIQFEISKSVQTKNE
ncbi:MAG: hypothetical protein AAGA30_13760 [Planctomycetota bacterium]